MSRESHSFPIRLTEANASFEPLKDELNSSVPQLTHSKAAREREQRKVIIGNPLPYIMLMSAKLLPMMKPAT